MYRTYLAAALAVMVDEAAVAVVYRRLSKTNQNQVFARSRGTARLPK
jgi:hypothetical protein